MRKGKGIVSLLLAVLMGLCFVMPAAAEESLPATWTYDFNGMWYADGDSEISVRLEDICIYFPGLRLMLFPTDDAFSNRDYSTAKEYSFEWSLASGIDNKGWNIRNDAENRSVFISRTGSGTAAQDAERFKNQDLFTLKVSKDGRLLTTITCHMNQLAPVPTWRDDIVFGQKKKVYFTPGESLTIQLGSAAPSITGGKTMLFSYYYHVIGENGMAISAEPIEENIPTPFITFVPPADADGNMVRWDVTTDDWLGMYWNGYVDFVLVDRTLHPEGGDEGEPGTEDSIKVPQTGETQEKFTVQPNASIKLKLPAASGAAGRQLLYNWYRSTDGGYNFAFLASSITPELTINNTEEKGGVYYYICDVQYADESGENAILYKTLFEVTLIGRDGTVPTPPDEPVTPGGSGTATNVPKTGDETPLATLGTLLLLSLLGVGALLLYRRRSA